MNAIETRSFASKLTGYFKDPSVAIWRKLAGLVAFIYVVSPIDIIPDFIPVLGWLDDIGVVSAVVMFMIREIKRHGETKASTVVVDAPAAKR